MRYTAIRQHLKPYSIVARRTTTINHAFAAAIAPCDLYDEQIVRDAVAQLGQDPDNDLLCVYCESTAETWDHIHATVQKKVFSGFGHRLGNLLPCCKPCNSRKGNKAWQAYLNSLAIEESERARRESLIESHITRGLSIDSHPAESPQYLELLRLRNQVLELFAQADLLARHLRARARPR